MTAHTHSTEPGMQQRQGHLEPREFPVREYIGAMAVELAQMARWDGDEELGRLLDAAAARASDVSSGTVPMDPPARRRTA